MSLCFFLTSFLIFEVCRAGKPGAGSLTIQFACGLAILSLPQQEWCREEYFGEVVEAMTGVYTQNSQWKTKQNWEAVNTGILFYLVELQKEICNWCPLVSISTSTVYFSPSCRWFGGNGQFSKLTFWLIIHLESLLVMLGTLLFWGLMLLGGMPLKFCDLLLSCCNGCFRNWLTSSDSVTALAC